MASSLNGSAGTTPGGQAGVFPSPSKKRREDTQTEKTQREKTEEKGEKKIFFFIKKMVVIGISNSRANNLRRKLSGSDPECNSRDGDVARLVRTNLLVKG